MLVKKESYFSFQHKASTTYQSKLNMSNTFRPLLQRVNMKSTLATHEADLPKHRPQSNIYFAILCPFLFSPITKLWFRKCKSFVTFQIKNAFSWPNSGLESFSCLFTKWLEFTFIEDSFHWCKNLKQKWCGVFSGSWTSDWHQTGSADLQIAAYKVLLETFNAPINKWRF